MLDWRRARGSFPALETDWALMDNAGGSVAPRAVIDRITRYLETLHVQLGASYPQSATATRWFREGHRAAEALVGAAPGEVVLGPSTTANAALLGRALAPSLRPGDEVVVTDLDHEANIGAWRRLAERGVVLREWRFDRESCSLEARDLEALLTDRTRLVCFTHCSNLIGRIHDVAGLCRLIRQAGAAACVDGVAYAPHRRVDVEALGADFYLLSLYKVYGPHLGLLHGRRRRLLELAGQNHFFFAEDSLPDKLEPGSVPHELVAGLPGILDYLGSLAPPAGPEAPADLDRAFEAIAAHEETLVAPLLAYLDGHPKVRVLGPTTPDRTVRVPTVSFTVAGRGSDEIPAALERDRIAVRFGHFYARRAIEALGLSERQGVVRISLVHYNTEDEVRRLLTSLDRVL